jgi:hypothetical protein
LEAMTVEELRQQLARALQQEQRLRAALQSISAAAAAAVDDRR